MWDFLAFVFLFTEHLTNAGKWQYINEIEEKKIKLTSIKRGIPF